MFKKTMNFQVFRRPPPCVSQLPNGVAICCLTGVEALRRATDMPGHMPGICRAYAGHCWAYAGHIWAYPRHMPGIECALNALNALDVR